MHVYKQKCQKNCIKIWSLILHDVLLLHFWERGHLARIHNLKAWHQSKGRLNGATYFFCFVYFEKRLYLCRHF